MTSFLRKISRSKWYEQSWLNKNEAPADTLSDIKTEGNVLCFWEIENNQGNLARVIAALTANYDKLSHFDYALIDSQRLQNVGVQLEKTRGDTLDEGANIQWHYEIRNMPANKLAMVANAILIDNFSKDNYAVNNNDKMPPRMFKNRIGCLLVGAIKAGNIELNLLKDKLKEEISLLMKQKQ